MRRIATAAAVILALWAWGGVVQAAEVVVLVSADLPPYLQAAEGIKGVLAADLPEEEVVVLSLAGKQERWAAVSKRIEAEQPRVVVPVGSLATVLAARKLEGPALAYSMILNPSRLLGDAPGTGRITGVSMSISPEQIFGRIRSALPQARSIGVLYDPARSGHLVDEARIAAASLGFDLVPVPVAEQRDLPDAVKDLCGRRVDVLWLFVDRTVMQTREGLELIMLETLRGGIPVIAPSERYARAGALLAVSVDYEDLGAQTGHLVRRILEDTVPFPAPERPRVLVLSVNEKVREALDLEFPSTFHEEVTRVIQ